MKYVICICDECAHSWLASGEIPARCAKCKSSQWDGQEKRERGRPRKNNDALAPKNVEAPEEFQVNLQPAKKRVDGQSLAKRLPNTMMGMSAKEGYCPHRKQKGEVCYKCDPKLGFPAIKTGA